LDLLPPTVCELLLDLPSLAAVAEERDVDEENADPLRPMMAMMKMMKKKIH